MAKQIDLFEMIADAVKPSFHNSIPLEGEELKKANQDANNQEREIVRFLQRNPGKYFAPHQLEEHFDKWPLTSIRRALSNLTKKGILMKSLKPEIMGSYGKPVNGWMLNPNRQAA